MTKSTLSQSIRRIRSYERQEIDKLPSVHLGPYASNLEKNGEKTELGNFNRAIEEHNKEKMNLLDLIEKLKSVLSEIAEKLRRLKTNSQREPSLPEIMLDYLEIRKNGRSDWGFYAKQNCSIKDLKEVSSAIVFLNNHNITKLEDYQKLIESANRRESLRKKIEEGKQIISHLKDARETKEVYLTWKGKTYFKDGYRKAHSEEIDKFINAKKYLKIHNLDTDYSIASIEAELEILQKEFNAFGPDIPKKDSDEFKELIRISKIVSTVLGDMELKDKGTQPLKEKETIQGKLDRFNDTVKQNKEEEKTKYETKITNKEEVR